MVLQKVIIGPIILPRTFYLTIYKAFVRPYLDYADTIYDKLENESFKNWFEKTQYNSALTITGAFRDPSRERIDNKLGLESLVNRR